MKTEIKKLIFFRLLPIIGLAVAVSLCASFYKNSLQESMEEAVKANAVSTTEIYAERADRIFAQLHSIGKNLADCISMNRGGDIKPILEKAVSDSVFYNVVLCRANGDCISAVGEGINLTQAKYFHEVMAIEEYDIKILSDDEVTGQSAILVVVNVPNDTSRLLLYYSPEDFAEQLSISREFDLKPFAAILDENGNVVFKIHSDDKFLAGNVLWDNIDARYQAEVKRTRSNIKAQRNGSITVAVEGTEKTIVYASLNSKRWTYVSGINQTYIENQAAAYRKESDQKFLLVMVVLFVGLFFIALINIMGSISGMKNSEVLKDKADTDLLTGLNNKLATERLIKEYMAQNPNTIAMMFVLDIDNFKKINDTIGHSFGDEVLRELGRQIGINFRVTDIIGRTGGDEFTIFLKNLKDDSNAIREAQKLVYFFKHFQVGDYVKYSATASIGAALFPADGADFDTLYKSADIALYKAKKRGKNQLAFYDDRDRK